LRYGEMVRELVVRVSVETGGEQVEEIFACWSFVFETWPRKRRLLKEFVVCVDAKGSSRSSVRGRRRVLRCRTKRRKMLGRCKALDQKMREYGKPGTERCNAQHGKRGRPKIRREVCPRVVNTLRSTRRRGPRSRSARRVSSKEEEGRRKTLVAGRRRRRAKEANVRAWAEDDLFWRFPC
jgi:hypothetical protein